MSGDRFRQELDVSPAADGTATRDVTVEVYGTAEPLPAVPWSWRLLIDGGPLYVGEAVLVADSVGSGEATCHWRYPFVLDFPADLLAHDTAPAYLTLAPDEDIGLLPPSGPVSIAVHATP